MDNCVFCNILAKKLPSSPVFQDEICTAFLDIQPVNPGHVLIIPNQHASYLADLDEDIGARMFQVAQRIASALSKSGLKCEGVNFFLADGEAAGQEIFHVHLHVFPRYSGDDFEMIFGPSYSVKPDRKALDEVAARIRSVL